MKEILRSRYNCGRISCKLPNRYLYGVHPVLRSRNFFGRLWKSEVPEPTPVPTPTKLGRLQLQAKRRLLAAPAPHTKICNFELFKKLFINASEKMLLRLSVRPTTQNNICKEGIYFSASSTTLQNFSVTVKAKDNRYRVLLKSQVAKFNFVSC